MAQWLFLTFLTCILLPETTIHFAFIDNEPRGLKVWPLTAKDGFTQKKPLRVPNRSLEKSCSFPGTRMCISTTDHDSHLASRGGGGGGENCHLKVLKKHGQIPKCGRKHFLHPRGYLINLIVLKCSLLKYSTKKTIQCIKITVVLVKGH